MNALRPESLRCRRALADFGRDFFLDPSLLAGAFGAFVTTSSSIETCNLWMLVLSGVLLVILLVRCRRAPFHVRPDRGWTGTRCPAAKRNTFSKHNKKQFIPKFDNLDTVASTNTSSSFLRRVFV